LKKFAKLTGKDGALEVHSQNHYHIEAVEAAQDFLRTFQNPEKNVANQVDSQRARQVKENCERLEIAYQNVVWLGRQNWALRGHREGSKKTLDDPETFQNEGNFRELLKFQKSCGDEAVKNHLATATPRNMLTSDIVQKDLIDCIGKDIIEQILERIAKCKFYCVLFDETTDISHISQLSFALRYVHIENEEIKGIREDFIYFVDAREKIAKKNKTANAEEEPDQDALPNVNVDSDDADSESAEENVTDKRVTVDSANATETEEGDCEDKLAGEKLASVVVATMEDCKLNPKHCVANDADGCIVNTSEDKGAIPGIQETAVNADRNCLNHCLNLSLTKSSTVPAVRKAMALMKETGSFFFEARQRNTDA